MAKKKEVAESVPDSDGVEIFYPTLVVDIDSLRPWPTNYLNHPDEQVTALSNSLGLFGQAKNIVTWRGYIVAGHGLVEGAKRAGWARVEVKALPDEMPEIQVEAYLIADNRTAELSTKNETLLGDMLQRIRANGGDGMLPAVGYNSAQIDSKLRALSQMGFAGIMGATSVAAYNQAAAPTNGQVAQVDYAPPSNGEPAPMPSAQVSFTQPAGQAMPYVQLQFPMMTEQRNRVLEVLTHVQKQTGLTTSIQALLHLCEEYAVGNGL